MGRPVFNLIATMALLLASLLATAQMPAQVPVQVSARAEGRVGAPVESEGDWLSYRDAYRVMLRFEKYAGPKNLIQNHFQITTQARGTATEGLRLSLQGRGTRLEVPLDAGLRAVLPLLKSAYDDNAVLRLNRQGDAFGYRSRVSILPRPDGVYDTGELMRACEQVLLYQSHLDATATRGKQCVGVNLVYPKMSRAVPVQWRRGERSTLLTASARGALFAQDTDDGFLLLAFRFADAGGPGQLLSPVAPLAIVALIE